VTHHNKLIQALSVLSHAVARY